MPGWWKGVAQRAAGGGNAGTDNISARWVMKLDELNTAGGCLLIERDLIWHPCRPQNLVDGAHQSVGTRSRRRRVLMITHVWHFALSVSFS